MSNKLTVCLSVCFSFCHAISKSLPGVSIFLSVSPLPPSLPVSAWVTGAVRAYLRGSPSSWPGLYRVESPLLCWKIFLPALLLDSAVWFLLKKLPCGFLFPPCLISFISNVCVLSNSGYQRTGEYLASDDRWVTPHGKTELNSDRKKNRREQRIFKNRWLTPHRKLSLKRRWLTNE